MPLTSRGEVLGVLEREAKRAQDLYEAVLALNKLDDDRVTKERELSQLRASVAAESAKFDKLQQIVKDVEAAHHASVQAAKARTDQAVQAIEARVAAARLAADVQIKSFTTETESVITRLRREREVVERAAADAREHTETVTAELDAQIAERRAELDALSAKMADIHRAAAAIIR